jgi:hypothetical protein
MAPTTYVLLPTADHAEMRRARQVVRDREDRAWNFGSAVAHTVGQRLYGDVVLVGVNRDGIERDAQGKVYRVGSIEELAGLDFGRPAPAPQAPATGVEPVEARETVAAETPAEPPADAYDNMTRVQLIQEAASRWPGAESWARMDNPALRQYIREREAAA